MAQPDAFIALYERDAEAVLVFFTRRTLDVEVSLDLTAETFAQAWRGWPGVRTDSTEEVRGWLFTIARRQLGHYLRRGHVERRALRRMGVNPPALYEEDYGEIERAAGLAALRPARPRPAGARRGVRARGSDCSRRGRGRRSRESASAARSLRRCRRGAVVDRRPRDRGRRDRAPWTRPGGFTGHGWWRERPTVTRRLRHPAPAPDRRRPRAGRRPPEPEQAQQDRGLRAKCAGQAHQPGARAHASEPDALHRRPEPDPGGEARRGQDHALRRPRYAQRGGAPGRGRGCGRPLDVAAPVRPQHILVRGPAHGHSERSRERRHRHRGTVGPAANDDLVQRRRPRDRAPDQPQRQQWKPVRNRGRLQGRTRDRALPPRQAGSVDTQPRRRRTRGGPTTTSYGVFFRALLNGHRYGMRLAGGRHEGCATNYAGDIIAPAPFQPFLRGHTIQTVINGVSCPGTYHLSMFVLDKHNHRYPPFGTATFTAR